MLLRARDLAAAQVWWARLSSNDNYGDSHRRVLVGLEMVGWVLDVHSPRGRISWVPDSRFDTYFFDPPDDVLQLLVGWTPGAVCWFNAGRGYSVGLEDVLLSLPRPITHDEGVDSWIGLNPFAELGRLLPFTNGLTKRAIRVALCRQATGFDVLDSDDQRLVFTELSRLSLLADPERWLRERIDQLA